MYAVRHCRYQPDEPQWRDHRCLTASELPQSIRPWLLDRGSLTARLVRASGGDFRVQVLEQSWQRPRLTERRLLEMGDREQGIIREVLLICRGEPWVYARSVLPARSLEGRLRHLRKLRDSALGALLFSDPSMRRASYEVAAIDGLSPLIPADQQADATLWGRRSCFYLSGLPLMVSEIFLPAFRP
ncbi:chorismate--pyruvate lyase [Litorivivens lipolytica]|uniref:Probable chorismate pyruvate-lyase n=1 Tax=Litorivivens lipolytica TaxID=1524264 RepID=A0A7W4Z6M8_9GAMM|nr:chorismate lyase [Litorivivens lipolytica]MBB3048453.1 chorismate--pyruvate lyase [Litorivivens lipolytica]